MRQLSRVLQQKLEGAVASECFSQNKDELIIRFEIGSKSFIIRASLSPELSCLSFPDTFQRARKNSVDLFPSIIGRRVASIRQFDNERSFAIRLSEGHGILFKMHGNRTNLIHFHDGSVQALFRKNLSGDANIDLNALDRTIDWSLEHFMEKGPDHAKSIYFTFGKVVWQYLENRGFLNRKLEDQWGEIQAVRTLLEHPAFYITFVAGKPILSLLPTGEVRKEVNGPLEAANEFFHTFTQQYIVGKERGRLLAALGARLAAGEQYIEKNTRRLNEVRRDERYKEWADLIMANLHAISPGSDRVVVANFYDDQGAQEEIRLKKELSPQKNAELYYRKAKNQHIEIQRLEDSIVQKKLEQQVLKDQIAAVLAAPDFKTLKNVRQTISPSEQSADSTPLPYHAIEYKGYKIWVGKNAQANDELISRYSYKEDLWLHAKDVSGSHVLLKYQAGKNFPKDVIEYAGSLAAYNSKRKNESLCPVIVTPRKFVRKRKGDPPGTVVVEREEVILVENLKSKI